MNKFLINCKFWHFLNGYRTTTENFALIIKIDIDITQNLDFRGYIIKELENLGLIFGYDLDKKEKIYSFTAQKI